MTDSPDRLDPDRLDPDRLDRLDADHRPIAYYEDGQLILRASSLGACTRALFLSARGHPPVPPPEHVYEWFERGNAAEEELISNSLHPVYDRQREVQLPVEVPGSDSVIIRGHIDGIVDIDGEPVLAECKYMSKPLNWDSPLGIRYKYQIAIYCHALGLKRFQLMTKSPDGLKYHPPAEPSITREEIEERVRELVENLTSNTVPPCLVRDYPCPFSYACERSIDTDPILNALFAHHATINACRTAYDKSLSGIREAIAKRMSDLGITSYKCDSGSAFHTSRTSYDYARMLKDHPEIDISKYAKESSRYLVIKRTTDAT